MTNEVHAQPEQTLAQIAAAQAAKALEQNKEVERFWTGINCAPPPSQSAQSASR